MSTVEQTRGHPWFAALYDTLNRGVERRILAPIRGWVVGEATGRVLEVGAGTGLSFRHYRRDVQLVATEPDPYMLPRARRRAAALGLPVEFHAAPAGALPFPDGSFDAVVCTLVLCTVADPVQALGEIRRVLKPEGTFRFIEHVRADGWLGRAQDLVMPVWRRIGAGCHPNRRTGETIEAAGFRIARLEEHRLPLGMPLIAGVATPTGAPAMAGRT